MGVDGLDGGADHAEDAPVRVRRRQILLLDRTQRFGRSRVAGNDDERAAETEKMGDALEREAQHRFEGAVAVRRARVIAEVDIIMLRQQPADPLEDRQAAEPGVEDADRSRFHHAGSL